ncbi:disease resistance protein RPV1-like [Gossypium arboreum]|uniref:disease resistance protein RPV1-like n=1 Tax=Gossypium arboreum TaxID=29729 RepID=UPI0022F1BF81|nr:disease resistance protein RPV1-like [Gossypium arboreum]
MEGCTKLVDVHPSLGVLKRLKLLNLRECRSLRSLPTKIGMESLETLILSGCSNLARFPEIDGKMEHLKTLHLCVCCKVEYFPENLQQAKFLEELDLSKTAIKEPPFFISQLKNLKILSFGGCKVPSKLKRNLLSLFKASQRGRMNSIALTLPSLSGLSSLTKLTLRDCNLGEGDIPGAISCLSSFGNNFNSIPASLTRLSKLETLILSNCSLCNIGEGDIPSDVSGLTSLKFLGLDGNNFTSIAASLIHRSNLVYLGVSNCSELECLPMLPARMAIDWKDDRAFANSRKRFDVVIPEMKSQNGSANRENDSQWIGVAFCCIFGDDDGSEIKVIGGPTYIHSTYSGQSSSNGSVFQDNFETKNLSLEMSFQSSPKRYPSVKVKKCGVRIMYEKDLEEIKEVQYHTTHSCPNLEHIHRHSTENDGSAGSTSLVKRKSDIDETGEEGPQPKRMQNIFNFITGRSWKEE